VLRAPTPDAAWRELERLYFAILERADQTPGVQRALDRAAVALDALIDADAEMAARALVTLLLRLRAGVRSYVAAEPALAQFAHPAARIVHPEAGALPPQYTYFVAPLASIGTVGQTILRRLLERRVARDNSGLARLVLQELAREAEFTSPVLYHPVPRAELRAIAATRRGRGRPPGRAASTAGWTDVPDGLEDLVALIRPVVREIKGSGEVTLAGVAARLGVDERRIREAFAHHGIRGAKLLRVLRSEEAQTSG
jgi:hypothetical protein